VTIGTVRTMHQTTVRFGRDVWDELTRAADRAEVSVAQYVRDAVVVRLASAGGLVSSIDEDPPAQRPAQSRGADSS
jgi:hypothetical protein